MTYQKGRQQQVAVKTEATRLTAETATFTRWIPWLTFESKNEIAHELDESAYGNRGALLDKQIASIHGVWNLQSKLDVDIIDFFLHHTFGSSTPTTANGATTRVYSLLQSLQLPTFTTQFTRGVETNRRLRGCSPATLEISIGIDDSSFTVSGHAIQEEAGNALTSSYTVPTRKLMGQDTLIYFASTLAGLGSVSSPTGTTVKARSIKIKIETGVDVTRAFEAGAVTATDITADGFKITLEIELLHSTANSAVAFQTAFDGGTAQAFRIHALGTRYANIGASTLKPTLSLACPPSKIQLGNTIPLDDLITQTLTVEVEQPNLAVLTTIGANATI